jgi:hypothetical protein
MQEITPQVYIETGYAGVTLGAINWPHGLILIDSPFRADDARSWRSSLLNMGGGVERMIINLDAQWNAPSWRKKKWPACSITVL